MALTWCIFGILNIGATSDLGSQVQSYMADGDADSNKEQDSKITHHTQQQQNFGFVSLFSAHGRAQYAAHVILLAPPCSRTNLISNVQ